MDIEEETLLLALLVDEDEELQRIWVHSINLDRENKGEFHSIFQELREDKDRFFVYFRMTVECFDEILDIIISDIKKKFTHYRRPIQAAERLAVTLSE
ncbi:hypothetical protein NQ318_023547 [Aromia moschata]|uniref:Uncharacterized protein n=1 Tax=Aromia moschata TaxID=1265417 RepID=A0AAV8YPZ5_9CUCU|nr:hypothetical protein NQ318_023547 [Aromia moschata]